MTKDELVRRLAGEVREFLAVAESGNREVIENCESAMCQSLECLFEGWLQDKENLPRGFWLDGISPSCYGIKTLPDGLEFYGWAWWGDDSRTQWVAPLNVRAQLAPGGASLAKYRLDFGDAARGITRLPIGRIKRILERKPDRWMFTLVEELEGKR